MAISFFIAGDVAPRGILSEDFYNRGERIFAEMKPHISRADFSIVNLEAPVIKGVPSPIKKSGPCLGIAPTALKALREIGFDVFTLANNHFFDQGQIGVDNTINTCEELHVSIVGGGKTFREARKPLILEKDKKRVAVINACEHEFSIADNEHGGSNPLDLIYMQEDIAAVRPKVDYVVLILHGGVEQYHYPTPRMKRWYRHFIDLGADAIINHHQHCINGYEVYKGKPIFYGLGNFYFPRGTQKYPNSWNYGCAVTIKLATSIGFDMIPYKQTEEAIALRDSTEFKQEIDLYNLPIQNDFLLQQMFDGLLIDRENSLKSELLPSIFRNRITLALAKRGLLGKLYDGKSLLSLKNKLFCESHLESMQKLFTILTK